MNAIGGFGLRRTPVEGDTMPSLVGLTPLLLLLLPLLRVLLVLCTLLPLFDRFVFEEDNKAIVGRFK